MNNDKPNQANSNQDSGSFLVAAAAIGAASALLVSLILLTRWEQLPEPMATH